MATAAAVAGSAKADVSGFTSFATPNIEGTTPSPVGYSSNGSTFYLTDGGGGEGVSGFASNAQLVTSFNATFTATANGSADGWAFIVQNSSSGTAALGAGGGGAGYDGITNGVALQTEYYFSPDNGITSASGFTANSSAPGFYYTYPVALNTGDPIRVNVSYYGTTLTYSFLDLTTKTTQIMKYTGVNIPAAVGGNTAYVGFSGATGGAAASQNISNFSFVSAASFKPVGLTASSFTQDMVVEKTAPQTGARANVTADFDSGTAGTGETFYEQGYNTAAPLTGLPASGSTFVSQSDSSHTYTLQSYNASNALLVGNGGAASGTLTLSTPAAFRALSLLATSGDGNQPLSVTVNYSDGAASSVLPDVIVPDWFGTGISAYNANGRVQPGASGTASTFDNVNNNNPNLWEVDVNLPDTTDPIASITVADDGGTGRTAIFALSGAAVVAQGTLVYSGTGTPAASFDTTGSLNFQSNGTPTAFATGDSLLFDDTATGPTTITVQAAGVSPQLMTFNNNSKVYVFNGGAISAVGASFNGSSSVTFNDTISFSGAASVNAGTVIVGSTGNLSTGTLTIASGATVAISSGGQLTGVPAVVENGALNLSNASTTVGALTGNGAIALNGTVLTTGAGTAFTGTFVGTGGTLNLSGGTYTPPVRQPSAIYGLTGGINVGTGNTSASLVISDDSGQLGQTSSGSPITLTLGGNGTLTTIDNNNGAWGGNIVLAVSNASTGVATLATGSTGTLEILNPITGVGPVQFLPNTNGSNFNLNASSSYTGETRIAAPGTSFSTSTITLNANNGISPVSGVNFIGTNPGGAVLDLHGYNQTVGYLTGSSVSAGPNFSMITNTGGTTSTLTINGGNTSSGGPGNLGISIQGAINIVKTGVGNQVFSGNNSYSGTTLVTGGTLTASNSSAFSNSTVTLGGGKLGLSGISTINAATLSSFANFSLNASGNNDTDGYNGTPLSQATPYISSNNQTLYITSNNNSEGNSSFTKAPVAIPAAGFFANFIYQNDEGADGITFTLQNDSRGSAALGGPGGALGYSNQGSTTITSVSPSVAVQFNIYNGGGTGIGTNGTISDTTQIGNINFSGDTDPLAVSIIYNAQAQTVTETITDATNGSTGTITYGGINYAATLGSTSAYVGFTGGTGGSVSAQSVSNFSFGSIGNGPVSIANAVTTTANQSSGIELNVTNGFQSASIGSLNVVAGAKVTIDAVVSGTVTRGVLIIPTLTIAGTTAVPTGVIDIENNDLDLPGASLASISAYVKAGYSNGSFTGQGITSSNAAANTSHTTAVGVIVNNNGNGVALYGSGTTGGLFDGSNPGLNDILVKYTYFGDANLDGKVDGSDYSLVDAGYAADKAHPGSATGWYNGDFNYDGVVDGTDYALIDNAFNLQGVPKTGISQAIVADSTAQVAPAAVPEPASLGLLAVGIGALAARRRRA